jgi:ribosome-binding protein aMBF1 (putative translation factor)
VIKTLFTGWLYKYHGVTFARKQRLLHMADQEFRKKFGDRLRILRLIRRLTQEQLAELTGLSVNFISLVETGQSSPSAETISKLAKALGVNEGELFKFDER